MSLKTSVFRRCRSCCYPHVSKNSWSRRGEDDVFFVGFGRRQRRLWSARRHRGGNNDDVDRHAFLRFLLPASSINVVVVGSNDDDDNNNSIVAVGPVPRSRVQANSNEGTSRTKLERQGTTTEIVRRPAQALVRSRISSQVSSVVLST